MSDGFGQTHYTEMFTEDALAWNIREGFVNVQTSTDERFHIYNYSKTAVIEHQWNTVTMRCRGLILHAQTGMIAARPFLKFFNVSEHAGSATGDELLSKPFRVLDKMDGSLGICYLDRHKAKIATRGSFNSIQAMRANQILREKYPNFLPDTKHTFLFEIIYPSNRIVVDYGDMSDLVLLGIVMIEDGRELDIHSPARQLQIKELFGWDGPIVRETSLSGGEHYNLKPQQVTERYGNNDGSEEGYVLVFNWPPGHLTRAKVKHEEYVRLHRLITNLSSKDIWIGLMAGHTLDALHESQTSEVQEWITELYEVIRNDFIDIKTVLYEEYDTITQLLRLQGYARNHILYNAKFAEQAKKTFWDTARRNIFSEDGIYMANVAGKNKIPDFMSFMFAIRDGKAINEQIWNMLEPKFFRPFDDDGVSQEDAEPSEVYIG